MWRDVSGYDVFCAPCHTMIMLAFKLHARCVVRCEYTWCYRNAHVCKYQYDSGVFVHVGVYSLRTQCTDLNVLIDVIIR